MFCTAAPEAPLPRLSSRATSTACRCFVVGEDAQLQHVGVVERLRLELAVLTAALSSGTTETYVLPRVTLRRAPRAGRRRSACPAACRDAAAPNQHALPEIPDRRHEDRPPRQPEYICNLRHVLVLEAEPIEFERRRACRLSKPAIIDLPPPE